LLVWFVLYFYNFLEKKFSVPQSVEKVTNWFSSCISFRIRDTLLDRQNKSRHFLRPHQTSDGETIKEICIVTIKIHVWALNLLYHSLSLTHTYTHKHTDTLSLSHSHTHTLSLSHTHTHTHNVSHTETQFFHCLTLSPISLTLRCFFLSLYKIFYFYF